MLRVLIVDDEYPTHEALRIMVDWSALGCDEPRSAMDGAEALEMLRKDSYDIIITDIRMPNMNGIDMIRAIRNINAAAKIIIITAYDYFSYAREALRLEVEDYFLKPIDRHELENKLKKIVNDIQREKGETRDYQWPEQAGEFGISQLIGYLDHCFRQDLNVGDLGKLFHINPAYLGQQFHKATGQTIKDYVNRRRIDWVKHMLSADHLQTQQVIQMAGFRNSGYFYRKFQEVEGISFADWKKRIKAEDAEDER